MANKYFTTFDYNKFTSNTLDATITQKKLVNESDLNEKRKTLATKEEIKTLATKAELKAEQDKIVKLQTYDLNLFLLVKVTLIIMEYNFINISTNLQNYYNIFRAYILNLRMVI